MGTRNIRNFVDPSAQPFIVTIPFAGLVAATPLTVDSGVISDSRDFYGIVVRSSGLGGAFTFLLSDGEAVPLSNAPIDGLSNVGVELVRVLSEVGPVVPLFAPKGSKITVVLTTLVAAAPGVSGSIEIRGNTIKG